jgi:hypothetical protein
MNQRRGSLVKQAEGIAGAIPSGKALIVAIVVVIGLGAFAQIMPSPNPGSSSGPLADIKTEPHIYVQNGSGSMVLLDPMENFYMIHLVQGDVNFRKYSNHKVVIPDIILFSDGDSMMIDAVFDPLGYIHCTWSTDAYGGNSVMYLKTDSNGNVITGPTQLSALNAYIDRQSRIATNSQGQAYVVWSYYQGPTSNWPTAVDVLYAKIDSDGTIIFTQSYVAPSSWATGYDPDLLVDNDDNLHIVYQRGGRNPDPGYDNTYLYYKKFAADGTTVLVADKRYDATHFVYWVSTVRMTLDSQNRINLVFSHSVRMPADGGAVETFYMKIDINGDVLIGPSILSDDDGQHSTFSYLATDAYDNNYVFWSDKKDGNFEIYYSALDTDGLQLVPPTRLTDTPEFSSTYSMAAVFDSSNDCYWSYWQLDDGTYVIYPVDQSGLVADAGPDQEVNEGDVVLLDGSGSSGSTGYEYWDEFVFGADAWITSAPANTVLATFDYGGTEYVAFAATEFGTGKVTYAAGTTFTGIFNIMDPGNARHQLFMNSVKWTTDDKDPASCNILVVWGHREVLTYQGVSPSIEGSNVTLALEDAGYNVAISHDIPSSLAAYDAVIIPGIGWVWGGWVNPNLWSGPGGTNTAHKPTASEVAAVLDFVQNGGGLVASAEWEYGAEWLNDISDPMGIHFEAIAWDNPLTAYRVVEHPIFLKWGSGLTEIVSYEWDFTSDGTYDYIETQSNAPDGDFDGKTTHIYGDNEVYTATLRVTDESGNTDTDTCNVTVNNVAPSITGIAAYMRTNVTLRLAGEKWHDVSIRLFENGGSRTAERSGRLLLSGIPAAPTTNRSPSRTSIWT